MAKIKFVRVERDCDANKNRRTEGDVRGIIYDFDVMIDGEKRARISREAFGKGYYLQDADGRPIDPAFRHHRAGRKIDSQGQFEAVVSEMLDAGKIPTSAELATAREAEAAAKADKIAEAKDSMWDAAIKSHAVALYDALKAMLAAAAVSSSAARLTATTDAQTVIATVDAQASEWMAQVEANPGSFNIY